MKYRGVITWLAVHERELLDRENYTMAEVIDDAISIIKLHRPKKPVTEMLESGEFLTFCPNCGHELEDNDVMCERCTQVIDWSDDNDE